MYYTLLQVNEFLEADEAEKFNLFKENKIVFDENEGTYTTLLMAIRKYDKDFHNKYKILIEDDIDGRAPIDWVATNSKRFYTICENLPLHFSNDLCFIIFTSGSLNMPVDVRRKVIDIGSRYANNSVFSKTTRSQVSVYSDISVLFYEEKLEQALRIYDKHIATQKKHETLIKTIIASNE